MAVDYGMYVLETRQYFAMDATFGVAFWRVGVDRLSIFDVVVHQVSLTRDCAWCNVPGHEKPAWVVWVAHGDVAKCIEDTIRELEDNSSCPHF